MDTGDDILDAKKSRQLNRSVFIGGFCAAVAAFFVWLHLSHGHSIWRPFVAAGVVFAAYCCTAYGVADRIKRSEYVDEAARYWNDVERVVSVYHGTVFLTVCAIVFMMILARYA